MPAHLPSFLSSIQTDWIIIAAVLILVAAYTLRFGTDIPAALALALPSANVLDSLLPHAAFLGSLSGSLSSSAAQAGIFLAFAAALTFLFSRVISTFGAGSGSFFAAIFASAAMTIMLLTFWVQLPALETLWHFGPSIQAAFAEQYRFWWMVGSFVALAVARF